MEHPPYPCVTSTVNVCVSKGEAVPVGGFRGGVHPSDRKEATRDVPVARAPVPERLVLPLSQHLGAPCAALVATGDRVERGQVVGDIDAMISAPVHAPVSGEVTAVRRVLLASGGLVEAIEIVPDETQDFTSFVRVRSSENPRELVRSAGIVGLGGAAFPASVKLQPPHDMPIHTVILNGCECEPYLTCDHRVMLEAAARVVVGGRLIRDMVGAKHVVIGVESNKRDAIEALSAKAGGDVEIRVLPTRYPQGAEKQLIFAVLKQEVPHGKLPAATGALVHNVGTAAAIADAVELRKPLMERVITVTGRVAAPANLLTLLGTPVQTLIDAVGGLTDGVGRIIAGGPMTGNGLADLSIPVTKGTSGIVALPAEEVAPAVMGDQPCIRCSRCVGACPMSLQPFALGIYANRADWEGTGRYRVLDCIECGCCSFVCPTHRPLVQLIRRAKQAMLVKGAKL